MSECLFVADSRMMGWIPRRYAGWRIRSRVCPGRQLRELISTANDALRPATRLLVVVGLHCDLTYMTNYSAARPRGFMRLRTDPAVADICNVITTQDYAWRRSGALQVVWALPYIPNFEIYNRRRAQTMNFASFAHYMWMRLAGQLVKCLDTYSFSMSAFSPRVCVWCAWLRWYLSSLENSALTVYI